jgi:hypothetical protein
VYNNNAQKNTKNHYLKVKLKGEIDGEKVEYILKNAYKGLDFQEIPVLFNKNNGSISKFNSYFTFDRKPSEEKNGRSRRKNSIVECD